MVDESLNLDEFLTRHRLPDSFVSVANDFYVPLARWLHTRMSKTGPGTFILGINGAQGTGKSTLSNFLGEFLRYEFNLSVAELSIDDIYLTHAERINLSQRVHPLLATRGVPGTHDVSLGKAVMDQLCGLAAGESAYLPRFDKSVDDRRPAITWPEVSGPVDLIVFEGWCVGSTALPKAELGEPVNRLESEEDSDCAWRRYVNDQLATTYRSLFKKIDALVFLQAPGFEAIYRWRLEQERKLAASVGADGTRVMDDAGITRFLQFYERITRHNLATLTSRADVVLSLNDDHAVTGATCAE